MINKTITYWIGYAETQIKNSTSTNERQYWTGELVAYRHILSMLNELKGE